MKALKSSRNYPIIGKAEVDETVFGGQELGVRGRQNKKKKLVVICIEKKRNGVSRLYVRVINKANAKNLGDFIRGHIHLDAEITTDRWSGYTPLKKEFNNLNQIYSGDKGGKFPELHRVIMNLKGLLRDVHHYVEDLQDLY